MRLITTILISFLFLSVSAQKEGFIRSTHEKESLTVLNSFIKSLQLPRLNSSKNACEPYMVDDKTKITDPAFEKAHRHALHFKYPVMITQVIQIENNSKDIEYKIWIAKNKGMGVTPVSLHLIFPSDGTPPKVCNINNL